MPSKLPSIVVGAAVALILGLLIQSLGPASVDNTALGIIVGCVGCLSSVIAGVVAVWHYTNTNALTVSPGSGAGMGGAAAILGGLVAYLIALLLQSIGVLPTQEELAAMQLDALRDRGMSESEIEAAEQFAGFGQGPIAILIGLVLGAILGAIGGAIGAAVFKKGPAADPAFDDTI
jgi:hypothetical protein